MLTERKDNDEIEDEIGSIKEDTYSLSHPFGNSEQRNKNVNKLGTTGKKFQESPTAEAASAYGGTDSNYDNDEFESASVSKSIGGFSNILAGPGATGAKAAAAKIRYLQLQKKMGQSAINAAAASSSGAQGVGQGLA